MTFPNGNYAQPGVYTRTFVDSPTPVSFAGVRIPALMGEGNEILTTENLEVVRGSSSSVDQKVVQEDVSLRAVSSISSTGAITLTPFDGVLTKFQVRNSPIVTGDGSGTTTNNRSAILVRVNGNPAVVRRVEGDTGLIELAEAPILNSIVECTYFFNRTDTLITDDLSDQVTKDQAILFGARGLASGAFYDFNASNNELKLRVDRETEKTIVFPLGIGGTNSLTATQVANIITGAGIATLTASAYTDNYGNTAVRLVAQEDITITDGSANILLGYTPNQSTSRNRIFFTFQGPIVDGSNGGVTTTAPSDVSITVDDIPIVASSVDGQNRAITLPFAPKANSVVKVTYFFNTWQNTFDYLANPNVTEVIRAGITANRRDFVQGADFVLQDDVLIWGAASLVKEEKTAAGTTIFDEKQVSTLLVDNKVYLAECTSVVNTSVIPSVETRKDFQLPFQPTVGNGRNTPLGQDLYNQVSNGRIDVPTNRPDLIEAYWGYDVQEAVARGRVDLLKVDHVTQTITLKDPVPQGAKVFATFYYNVLTDNEFVLTSKVASVSGVGSYTAKDLSGKDLHNATFDLGTKGIGLGGITIEFPSGSELNPDFHFLTVNKASFKGAVEEIVTITFAELGSSPAKYTILGSSPYSLVETASDRLRVRVDNAELASGAAGINLSNVLGIGAGFFASVVSDEISYDASTGAATYTIDATNNSLTLTVDGNLLTPTVTPAAGLTVNAFVNAINTAAKAGGSAAPSYSSAGRFNSAFTVTVSQYDRLSLHYTGDVSGASGVQVITLTPATYNTAALLAAEIQAQLNTINGAGGLNGDVSCVALSNGRLRFTLERDPADAAGFLEFITDGTPARDFAIVAGIDTGVATGNGQTKLLDGDVARRFTVGSAPLKHDRLILRNRILVGSSGSLSHHHAIEQTSLVIQNAAGNSKAGLRSGMIGMAKNKAVIDAPSVVGRLGFSGGQMTGAADASDGQPAINFFDGTGTNAQNNEFDFVLDGVPINVVFTASASGTLTAVAPETVAGTVIQQVQNAIAAIPGQPFGNLVAVQTARIVRQEGAGVRITSPSTGLTAEIQIGNGSANDTLGFSSGEVATAQLPQVEHLASALMGHAHASGSYDNQLLDFANPSATYFAAEALASVQTDQVNNKYLYVQSQSLGVGSVIEFQNATANNALSQGTGLLVQAGDGDVGENGRSGFFVVSTNPNGSGSANTSIFNSGVGQDGFVGQTYLDDVTGLSFTILPREGGLNYPTANADFRINVSKTFVTDANKPTRSFRGLEVVVSNTVGVLAGNQAKISTFDKGGQEPAIGDLYYITYNFRKQNYETQLYTRLQAIVAAYGSVSPDNPVSLAAYLALLNGAVVVAIKQLQKAEGSDLASNSTYLQSLEDLKKPLAGGVTLNTITPLGGGNDFFYQALSRHVDLQSDIRIKQERTAIIGMPAGTTPTQVKNTAKSLGNTRVRIIYPDSALLTLTDEFNNKEQFLVEGQYLASAVVGSLSSPSYDVATPWTKRRILGFDEIARKLDLPQQNDIAVNGVTVLAENFPFLEIRHGLTTDMTNLLTQIPTVVTIADEVQVQSRSTLDSFIGIKRLAGVTSQIEGRLSTTLKNLQTAQIISAFTGILANPTDDPTFISTEAYYAPIFPILYILVNFYLRSQL